MRVEMRLAELTEVILPEDEHLAMENAAYRNSVTWHDDRIADILREREERGIDLSETTPAVTRLVASYCSRSMQSCHPTRCRTRLVICSMANF